MSQRIAPKILVEKIPNFKTEYLNIQSQRLQPQFSMIQSLVTQTYKMAILEKIYYVKTHSYRMVG